MLAGKSVRQRQIVIPALMASVSIEQRTLPPPFQQGMARDQAIIFEDPDFVSEAVDFDNAASGCIGDRVVVAANADHSFMADPALQLEDGTERHQGQRLQRGPFLGKGLIDDTPGRCVQTRIGDSAQPAAELRVQIVQFAERTAQEEVLANVAEWPLDLAFGLRPIGAASLRQIAVMLRKLPPSVRL